MGSFFKFLFTFIIIAGLGAAAVGWFYFNGEMKKDGPLAANKVIYIPPGNTGSIIETLAKEGVIGKELKDEYLFRFAAWRLKSGGSLKTNEYEFKKGISVADAVALIQSDNVYQRKLTIPEGLTSYEIVDLVNKAEAMDSTPITTIPAEGSLMPETYNYTHGEKRAAMIDRMAEAMKKAVAEYWPKKTANSLVKTPEEAVTMASIVERETALTSERPRVAGVFMNRIKNNWQLQSDPTVIYALTQGKGKLGRPLTREDLNVKSPYNTYLNVGLPPTPIANPGKESLIAVLAPETHQYMFFVADGSGGHAFAATLDEHNANVAKWRQLQAQGHQ